MADYIEEKSFLMELGQTTDLKGFDDEDALTERIAEWLATPQGTLIDLPSWGNPLSSLKFEPPGEALNIMAEMGILRKLPQDIENLKIESVSIEFTDIDCCKIIISHRLGTYEGSVNI
jgi:hypothetical protein